MPVIKMTAEEYQSKTGTEIQNPKPEVAQAIEQDFLGMPQQPAQPSWFSRALSDAPSDIKSALTGLSQRQTERSAGISQRQSQGQNPFSSGFQHLGNAAALGFDAAVTGATTGVKLFLTPEQEKKASEITQTIVTNSQTNPTTAPIADGVKTIVSKWNEFKMENPETAANFEAGANITDALTLLLGVGAVKNLPREAIDAAGDVIKTTATKADDLMALRRASQLEQQTDVATDAAGKIIQGVEKDKPKALSAFTTNIQTPDGRTIKTNLDGVTDYNGLNTSLKTTVGEVQEEMRDYLGQFDTKFTTQQLGKFEQVNGRTVVSTPVQDALEQMETYYRKTSQSGKAQEIVDLRNKMETEGLTVAELNKIAIDHGNNLNAFNVNGELASGLPRQAAENTRQGVKEVLRERLPDDYARQLDSAQSDILSTLRLTEDMAKKVNALQQRLLDRSLGQKLGDALFTTLDLMSMRSLGGFAARFGPGSRAKYPTGNALQLQDNIAPLLKEIERLEKIKDSKTLTEQIRLYLQSPQGGLSTKDVSRSRAGVESRIQKLNEEIASLTQKKVNTPDQDAKLQQEIQARLGAIRLLQLELNGL